MGPVHGLGRLALVGNTRKLDCMRRVFVWLALGLAAFAVAGCGRSASQQAPLSAEEQKIGETVRRYLLANPQVLDEVRAVQVRAKVEADPRNFALGPANAPVTIVEFMDYRCGFCHRAMDWVLEVVKKHPDKVRVVFVDYPVLGEASVEAASAALAAAKQEKYLTLHQAFMRHQGPLTPETIDAIARSNGVDVARMRRDMRSADVVEHLTANFALADDVGFSATPSFSINGVLVNGAKFETLDRLISEKLASSGS
jgi:protein-disulfide isomerase